MEHAWGVKAAAINHAINKNEDDAVYARYGGPEGYYEDVPDLFRPFSQMPDPLRCDPLIEDLRVLMAQLCPSPQTNPTDVRENFLANPELARMTDVSQSLEGWFGSAAQEFKGKFVDPFPAIAGNQFVLASVIRSAMQAYKALWASAWHDIDAIATTTIAALNADPCCDSTTWNFEFTVAASIASIAGVAVSAVTDGLAAPFAIAVVGALAQSAGADPPAAVRERDGHSGGTALQITNAMKSAMTKLVGTIRETEQRIQRSLQAAQTLVTENRDLFVAARPALADATPGNVTSGPFLGADEG